MLSLCLIGIMLFALFIEIPMVIGMLIASMTALILFFPTLDPIFVMQNLVSGVSSYVYLAIPMFILAAEIMCHGQCANRLLRLCRAFIGHLPGGLAITASATCTIFGAISGSTQATFVAVGKPMHRELRSVGYSIPHSLGLLMSSANIALLIPPSTVMIMYCVVTGASVSDLFMAGILPGILLFLIFAIYEAIMAKMIKSDHIIRQPKANFHEICEALKGAILPMGFPLLILGGIYSGITTPTEAASISVIYALILEMFVYRTLSVKKLTELMISTGVSMGAILVLTAAGQVFSWILTYAGVPQALASSIITGNVGKYGVFAIISFAFFVACMFMDCFPVILILTPIFYPIAQAVGIDAIHLGVVITLLSALGCVTPPFGCNIFAAMTIFDEKFNNVVRGLLPYILLSLLLVVILILFPQISLVLPTMAGV